ncbi:PLP-dependent transferase [Mycena maculata]|uniref:PLP-dependent transferase n=1 Tax=Mycena maculata TaxID=230809 RepID=A0AAD7MPZ4_9AGAR|nr:PLP-dependent transferase [Mycena maculata]
MGNTSSSKANHQEKASGLPPCILSRRGSGRKGYPHAEKTSTPRTKSTPRSSQFIPDAPGPGHRSDDAATAYEQFLQTFPGALIDEFHQSVADDHGEYKLTWILDTLRRSDYGRLDSTSETYLDYMGGALYPEGLIRVHTELLGSRVLGNTHSVSNSSKMSLSYAEEARDAVLSFFDASPDKYTVIFTPNATGALKLVGESYPFAEGSSYVLSCDSHNSVHGIREFAARRGARVGYIPSTRSGGFDAATARDLLSQHSDAGPNLFVMTAQSNISNARNPLSTIQFAASLGYHTVLDAAAMAATSTISLADCHVDAMAISFYKMFGFPTGVGALVAKKSFLRQLKRPWFAGGNVEVVQVPGMIVTRASELHEQFEDGTTNYLTLSAVTEGLRFLSACLPFLPLRLSCLMHYLTVSLSLSRHDTTDTPVVRILSAVPSRRLKSVGAQSDVGSLISLIFLSPSGEMIPNSFIEHAASCMFISLRTGCLCNPGGAAAMLGLEKDMERLYQGVTRAEFERTMGHELGVVRISLGLASNFQDVWHFVRFVELISQEKTRMALWNGWVAESGRSR